MCKKVMADNLSKKLDTLLSQCSSNHGDDGKLDKAKEELIQVCNSIVSLPYSIVKQDVITMLYMIGCNLSRNDLLHLAVKVFECAVESYNVINARKSGMLDTDEVILMKIFYEAGECWKKLQNEEKAAENLQSSLNLSFHCGDLSFERKLSLSLSDAKMKIGRYSEAAVGYLRALTILDDLSYVGIERPGDLHLEKINIHNQLAMVYVELKQYKQALHHALFDYENFGNLTPFENLKLIGTLYDHLDDPQSALKFYKKCYDVTEIKGTRSSSVIKHIVCNLKKLKSFDEALEYINKQLKYGSDNRDEFAIFSAALHKGDVFMLTGDIEAARSQYNFAMKLSQTFPDEYFSECKALCKIAESFSEEGRYMHALYECERALSLAQKSKSADLLDKIQLQVAVHSQHSTSEKELSSALATLCANITRQCENFKTLSAQELKLPNEELDRFSSCCKALQVILHRLHQSKAACEIEEWLNQCIVTGTYTEMPQVADTLSSKEKINYNFEHCLYTTKETCCLVFTCCRYDILANVLLNGSARSYLMSDHVINIKKTIGRIKTLLEVLQPQNDKKYSMFYHTEQRNLPQEKTTNTKRISLNPNQVGAGDQICTQTKILLPTTEEAGDHELKSDEALKELFDLLIKPLDLDEVETGSSLCVVADEFLAKIPFDQLIDTSRDKPMGETFNVSTTPCFLALNNNKSDNEPKPPLKSNQSIREQELARTFDNPSDLRSLQSIGIAKDLSGLVTSSATGVNVMTSPRYVTPHKRVAFPLKTCVIGAPNMPGEVKYENTAWKPKVRLPVATKECSKTAEYLKVDPLTGDDATKDNFLSEFSEATLMHVTTYGDLSKGVLAFKPNNFPAEEIPYSPLSYLVTQQDFIEKKPKNLQLMVLSSGHGWTNTDVKLPQILLTAGVACVVYLRWPVPDCVAEKFFFHFYMNLQKSCKVSRALFNAKEATKERFPDYVLWNAFTATGSDVTIDLSRIRQSQLQSRLNDVESPALETPPFIDEVVSEEERFDHIQEALSRLSGSVSGDSDVISFLLGLVEEATERLTSDDNVDRPIVVLPKAVENVNGTVELLSLMGFDLQPINKKSLPPASDRSRGADKMVIFPHWNQDSLLLPCHQALIGLHELCQNPECLRTMALMLPLQQEILSHLIDLLSIVHHTPEVELRTTDTSVRELWQQRSIRGFLNVIGISNVMELVFFSRSLLSRSCLLASLQFLTSFSLHRDQSVLEQLDVTSLGKIPQTETAVDPINLDSLKLALLPRNEVAVKSSWMSDESFEKEKKQRKKLADDIRKLSEKYSQALEHAKWWHRDVRVPQQADNSLASQDSPKTHTRKVKVQPGVTPSCNRILLDDTKPETGLLETLSRRSEARCILQRRCDDLNRRHSAHIRDTYLRYVDGNSVQ